MIKTQADEALERLPVEENVQWGMTNLGVEWTVIRQHLTSFSAKTPEMAVDLAIVSKFDPFRLEDAARALCESYYRVKEIDRSYAVTDSPWNEQGTTGKQEWREMAQSVLAVLSSEKTND